MYAADLDIYIDNEQSGPAVIVTVSNIESEPFIRVLEEGYRSEIIYSFRIRKLKHAENPLNISSSSFTITKKAGKDFLTNRYYIQSDGNENIYDNADSFKKAFFSCRTALPAEVVSGDFYIEAKAETDLIRRPPPLALLDPFLISEKTQTGWVRYGN